jgi:hypothetical protein
MESVAVHVTAVTVGEVPEFATCIVGFRDVLNTPEGVDHEYDVNVPVPPVGEHVNWTVAPEAAGFGVAVAVTTTGMAPLIVRLTVADAWLPLLSVTVHVAGDVIAVEPGFEATIAGFRRALNVPALLDHEYDV